MLIGVIFLSLIPNDIAWGKSMIGLNRTTGFILLGLSGLAFWGSSYFKDKATEKYDEAEKLWNEYLALPSGTDFETFEEKYESYQDKYGEAVYYRKYFWISLAGGTLLATAGLYLVIFNPEKKFNLSYNYNPYTLTHNFSITRKF